MNNLSDYRERVARMMRDRTGEPLLNGSMEHASAITQEAFNCAKHSVRILSNRLSPDCYARESVCSAAKYFLADSKHKLQILVESALWDTESNFDWSKHPLIQELAEFARAPNPDDRRLELRAVPPDWVNRYTFNFLLLDDYGMRFEADRSKAAAVATFFPEDKKGGIASLSNIFEQLWQASTPITIN